MAWRDSQPLVGVPPNRRVASVTDKGYAFRWSRPTQRKIPRDDDRVWTKAIQIRKHRLQGPEIAVNISQDGDHADSPAKTRSIIPFSIRAVTPQISCFPWW